MSGHDKRRTVLVDHSFQIRFALRLALILVGDLCLFFTLAVVAPPAFGWLAGSPNWGVFEAIFRVDVLLYAVLLPLAATFLCLFAQGVRESFRIAGPHARFRSVLRDLANLRVAPRVKLRRDDYLHETADSFSAALAVLHGELRGLKELADTAAAAAEEDRTSSSPERRAVLETAVRDLRERLARFDLGEDAAAPGNAAPAVASSPELREPLPLP